MEPFFWATYLGNQQNVFLHIPVQVALEGIHANVELLWSCTDIPISTHKRHGDWYKLSVEDIIVMQCASGERLRGVGWGSVWEITTGDALKSQTEPWNLEISALCELATTLISQP